MSASLSAEWAAARELADAKFVGSSGRCKLPAANSATVGGLELYRYHH
jgi:hypothetical protein